MEATFFALLRGPILGALQGPAAASGGSGAGAAASAGSGAAASASPVIADGGLLGATDPTAYYAIAVAVMAIAVAVVLYPLVRAWAKRMEQPKTIAGDSGTDQRMRQLEQSVEALTLEIERISEGQRYTTKLLTERLPLAAKVPQPGQSEKTLL